MSTGSDPWDTEEFHFISREVALVRHLVGAGATSLGKACFGDNIGEYYRAFFELSVGMERLAKLILVVDYSMKNQGGMPDQKHVRSFGHELKSLFDAVEAVAASRCQTLEYQRPTDAIATVIVENLDAFADAKRGRYANFAALGNAQSRQHEPVAKWWNEVAGPILAQRYYGKDVQRKNEKSAREAVPMLGRALVVGLHTEAKTQISDFQTAMMHSGMSNLVQKWSRYHVLTIIRWLAVMYCDLSQKAAYDMKLDAFFGSWEFLDCYRAPDNFLKTRKVWPMA